MMIELFKFHWKLIRRPSRCLENDIIALPLWICVISYSFYSILSLLSNKRYFSIISDFYYSTFPKIPLLSLIGFTLLYKAISLLIIFYLQPVIAKMFYRRTSAEPFNIYLFRKIILSASISFVIYALMILMPLKIIAQILHTSEGMNTAKVVVGGLAFITNLWLILPLSNYVVIYFKGLKKYFNFTIGISLLIVTMTNVFIILLFQLLTGGRLLSFLANYMMT